MSRPAHTYGSSCHLAPTVAASNSKHGDLPPLQAHFFYSSQLPIDDPLTAIPAPTGAETKSVKHPPRPFSARDNNALEEAWLALGPEHQEPRKKGRAMSPKRKDQAPRNNTSASAPKSESHNDRENTKNRRTGKDRSKNNVVVDSYAGTSQAGGQGHTKTPKPISTSELYGRRDDTIQANIYGSSVSTAPLQSEESGTSGLPFLKFSSRAASQNLAQGSEEFVETDSEQHGDLLEGGGVERDADLTKSEPPQAQPYDPSKHIREHKDVPVGISKLHLVKLPSLQMQPIYWSPVHDVASVIRGTWFYKESMCPVEPAVANQLEVGYRDLRPWSQTWIDELNSAVEVGAVGEEKIVHALWPREEPQQSESSKAPEQNPSTDLYGAVAADFHAEASAQGSTDPDKLEGESSEPKIVTKRYASCQIIYKDSKNAFILKPTLQPSSYYGRKPLQKIRRGMAVGIHCVRGFDWKAWEKLHPSRKSTAARKVEENAPVAVDVDTVKRSSCPACKAQEEQPKVTDLILVIHGIGQKLSERVESFHFTHAINSFRRSVNVELSDETIHRALRKDLGGVMVLPVNWRSNLSFEEGGPLKEGDKAAKSADFSLKDITPTTIPAVRNMISDVMLDIPFYMSHHKPRMIKALISEANRVYRLWCKNNPDFHDDGRVHIIAHSLGSVMALEVLSQQPTLVPRVDLESIELNTNHFDFCTTNLFFVGSPAGFFLLLDKGQLTPRRSQKKTGADRIDDTDKQVTSEAGTLGCLAVDNIYNIIHYNDPVAYQLNATIDPRYAATLKNAQVPSASKGFFESIGNAMRSITPGVAPPTDLAVGQIAKPSTVTRLPSQLEMEVHDFTREEIAEKKFNLLNDAGQVDWFLSTGGGPLEIQYLNMLGAHSSYWNHPDFLRLVVLEIGRKPGRKHVLPNMRAVKAGRKQ